MSDLWYRDGLRFECQQCGSCCVTHGANAYVHLAQADIEALTRHCGLSRTAFLSRFCEREGQWFQLKNVGPNCIFLQNRRCAVHPTRPMQCATWPFWTENLDQRTWNDAVRGCCKGIGRGRLYTAEEIQRIARSRDEWYSRPPGSFSRQGQNRAQDRPGSKEANIPIKKG